MKVMLPEALNCGCSYELFWHLNPKKLEPFRASKKSQIEADSKMDDVRAWLIGMYVRLAIGSSFDKKVTYPEKPFSQETNTQPMSDGERFREFVAEHNKQVKKSRKKDSKHKEKG